MNSSLETSTRQEVRKTKIATSDTDSIVITHKLTSPKGLASSESLGSTHQTGSAPTTRTRDAQSTPYRHTSAEGVASSSGSTNLTGSAATTTRTNQVQSIPQECLTATNLSQYWRAEYNGRRVRGGGPHSKRGEACDLHSGLQWFRFTGLAGKLKITTLNKCLRFSCSVCALESEMLKINLCYHTALV